MPLCFWMGHHLSQRRIEDMEGGLHAKLLEKNPARQMTELKHLKTLRLVANAMENENRLE